MGRDCIFSAENAVPMLASVVFTTGAVAMTSTVVLDDTFIEMSRVVGVPTAKVTPFCVIDPMLGAAAVTSYVAGGTCWNWYSPFASVLVSRDVPWAGFLIVTVAPGTTAPLGSITVPRRDEVAVWVKAAVAKVSTTSRVRLIFSRRISSSLGLSYLKKRFRATNRYKCEQVSGMWR